MLRPREKWVWSATPTHEAIVPRELFDAVEERPQRNVNPARSATPKHYPQRRNGRVGRLYVLRGRVRCGLCGRRMEGSHQKGSNWYRCQYVSRRGEAAADLTGHPRVLGIKEDVVLDALRGFMSERLFGPERLKLLRAELADAATDGAWQERDSRLADLRAEEKQVEQALYRQSLRLEEHEDPEHPVLKLATRRIEELSGQADAIAAEIASLEAARPEEPRSEEIEALLADVPDLREALAQADGEELIELLDAFDVAVSYDKPERTLELSALLANDFVSSPDAKRPPDGRSRNSSIAGAGFEPATFGL